MTAFIMHHGYQSELKDLMRKALRKETGISVPVKLTEREPMPVGVLNTDSYDELFELFNPPPFLRRLDAFNAMR